MGGAPALSTWPHAVPSCQTPKEDPVLQVWDVDLEARMLLLTRPVRTPSCTRTTRTERPSMTSTGPGLWHTCSSWVLQLAT